MNGNEGPIWLVSGVRTPFVRVDGPLTHRDSLGLSVPVVQAMAASVKGQIDFAVWGAVILNLSYNNIAREVWLEAGLDPHVPTFTTIMQCSTSMVAVFEAAGMLNRQGRALALAGGVESMSRVQIGLTQGLSFWIRRIVEARSAAQRLARVGELRLRDIRLKIPEVKNRATGRSMGEHCEDMAKTWGIGRREQDEVTLRSHQRAVAGQERGFFADLIVAVDGVAQDAFPRRDTSLEKLAALKPVFDRTSGKGTLTAGNSSPLTDGAAGIWIATDEGLSRLPDSLPRARLVDYEIAAVDLFHEGLLMAPVSAIPRLLSRHRLSFDDIALWEIHEAFAAQLLCNVKGLEDKAFVREKAGVEHNFGTVPRDRINPNGGSVALGHPFGATGARILSQAVKELAELPRGSRAIVSICSDGGLGTVALLAN
ncbi:MAG TPA: acetyl-CoA C-acyltransferase [Alphaproteobacteria bacterium]